MTLFSGFWKNRTRRCLLVATLLAMAVVVWLPSLALGCSCIEVKKGRQVLPADGAIGVPTDAVIRIVLVNFLPELRERLAAEYRLRDEAGNLVPLESRVVATRLDLTPKEPLRPESRYTLEQVYSYAASGLRMTDSERWEADLQPDLHPDGIQQRGFWYPVTSFETGLGGIRGEGAEGGRSAREVAVEAELDFGVDGVCSWGPWLQVTVESTSGLVETDVLELQVEGHGTLMTSADLNRDYWTTGNSCDPDGVGFSYEPPLRARLVAVDLLGREVGGSGWVDVKGPAERIEGSTWDLQPAQEAAIERWSALAVETGDPESMAGGGGAVGGVVRACPFGFESVPIVETEPPKVVRQTTSGAPLRSDGQTAWTTFADEEGQIELVSIVPGGWISSRLIPYRGYPQVAVESVGGLHLIALENAGTTAEPEWDHSTGLATLDPEGGVIRWRQRGLERVGGFGLAAGGGKVLAAWESYAEDSTPELVWRLFDVESGEPVAAPKTIPNAVPNEVPNADSGFDSEISPMGAPAVAFVNDRFLLFWGTDGHSGAGPLETMVIEPDGSRRPVRRLDLRGNDTPGVAVADSFVGLVSVAEGRVEWSLLNGDSEVQRGPVVVSAGVGGRGSRLPQIAWNGNHFAILWSSNPGVFVAAVDLAGNVSPALQLHGDVGGAFQRGIAAVDGEFVASWADPWNAVHFASLSCRAAPASGPPQQIPPF